MDLLHFFITRIDQLSPEEFHAKACSGDYLIFNIGHEQIIQEAIIHIDSHDIVLVREDGITSSNKT